MRAEKFNNGVIFQGDCLEVMPKLPAKSIDAVITDPPFGTTQCKWDAIIPLERMWSEVRKLSKPETPVVLFATQPFASFVIASNPKQFRYDLIYEKTNPTGHLNAKKMPLRAHENILVFYDKLPFYEPQKTSGHKRKTCTRKSYRTEIYNPQDTITHYDSTERYPRSVLKFATGDRSECLHPTQKPLDLMTYLIRTYTKPGQWILDFACGSGTTCLAAALEGRKFVGIEKEQKYFDIACKRLEALGNS